MARELLDDFSGRATSSAHEIIMKGKLILAFVGMPGAGKTEVSLYLKEKGIPFVRFGELTDEEVKRRGLELTPENERLAREDLRKEHGMGVYAIHAKPKIEALLKTHDAIAIDGLRSWEEYLYLKKQFPELTLIHIYAEPKKRYERLSKRQVRPVPTEKAYDRDVTELEGLNMGGPIAIADYLIENNGDDLGVLHHRIDDLLSHMGIT